MRRLLTMTVALAVLASAAYVWLAMAELRKGGADLTAACFISNSGLYIPASLCNWWLPRSLDQASATELTRTFHDAISAASLSPDTDKKQRALEVATLTLESGVNVNSINPNGTMTALHGMVLAKQPPLVAFLLEQGASPESQDQETGTTPLELARHLHTESPSPELEVIIQTLENET